MNGAHDLGGKHGFGEIDQSQQEHFPALWEQKVFALTLACGMLGKWNLDQSRHARERADPADYLAGSYYEHWLHGLELLLVEHGVVSDEELRSGKPESCTQLAVTPTQVEKILNNGAPTELEPGLAAKFAVEDRVVVQINHTEKHTRVPDYVQGKTGSIVRHHGAHVFADEHAASGTKCPQHLYCVRFEARALWGRQAGDRGAVYVDLFEPALVSLQQHIAQLQASGKK